MKKVKFLALEYDKSESLEIRGNHSAIERYLHDGYYVKEQRKDKWSLVRPSRVRIWIQGSAKQYDMKDKILEYYGKQKLSEKMLDKFTNLSIVGKIKFYLDENDELIIK